MWNYLVNSNFRESGISFAPLEAWQNPVTREVRIVNPAAGESSPADAAERYPGLQAAARERGFLRRFLAWDQANPPGAKGRY